MSVTEKLDKFMREHGFNKADVARLSGVPYTTIDGLYKKGDENTKLSTLRKLAAFIGCTIDELTDGNTHADQGYYFDPEAAKMAQELYDNPGMRILFDAAKNVSAEDLKLAAEIVARMKKKEEHDDD